MHIEELVEAGIDPITLQLCILSMHSQYSEHRCSGMAMSNCVVVTDVQDARPGDKGEKTYRYVQYMFVGAYWTALLGSCHLVATATPQISPLALMGECLIHVLQPITVSSSQN